MTGCPVSDDAVLSKPLRRSLCTGVRRMEEEGLPHPTFFEFLFRHGSAAAFRPGAGVEYAVPGNGTGRPAGRYNYGGAASEVCSDHFHRHGPYAVSGTYTGSRSPGRRQGSSGPGVPVLFRGDLLRKATASSKETAATRGTVSVKKSGKTRTKFSELRTNVLHFPVQMLIMEIPRGN